MRAGRDSQVVRSKGIPSQNPNLERLAGNKKKKQIAK